MYFKTLTVLFSLAALGAAQELENNDVPPQCLAQCQDALNTANVCHQQNRDDRMERQCVCGAQNAQSQFTACAACAKANGGNDPRGDLAEIVDKCSWNFNAIAAASGSGAGGGGAASTASAVVSTITSGGSAVVSTITSGAGGALSTITSGGSTIVTSAARSASASATRTPNAAGPVPTAAVGGVFAGLAMVALPAALL